MKDTTPQNPPPQNSQPPVTRWELIDAISKLYVIRDDPNQLKKTLNKPRKPYC
ncbi:hypothetical protein H6G17_09090 [Chroococcidiopsis sp. FACHB-1243]|uniref:hypothetical protein n=1 Tax=Chroococcidiopsis sp. [FACHB-1243] TaxID=2692781 RepID=UPI001780B2B9|nr:hypothetical protein [Chroococcidiopsis sp. [FACHB-1243]]MBD2305671.1 hypothetical protein [Chroococcidiopsis sp. [FACHB-1243]]